MLHRTPAYATRILTLPIARFRTKASLLFCMAAATLSILVSTSAPTDAQVRFEMRPVETLTLSAQQFLTGDKNVKSAIVAGELRIPQPGTDKLPAVILVHGAGGVSSLHERWVQELNSAGVATFLLDSYSGRGLVSLVNDESQLDFLAGMIDAYRALGILAEHPRIDSGRIAVMGFSWGSVAAVYSSNERFRKMYGPPNAEFAAHIGLYTVCNWTYHDDDKTTGKPIRLFHGIADNWVPIEPCRAYVDRLKNSGADAVLTEYPNASHAYDAYFLKQEVKVPQGQTPRNCLLSEASAGEIVNIKTGKRFDWNDQCVEKGPSIAYNEEATAATMKAIKDLITSLPPGGAIRKN